MSNRTNHLTVVLETTMREDDAETIIAAIECLRGVVSVKANVADPTEYMAISRARNEVREKLWKVLEEKE